MQYQTPKLIRIGNFRKLTLAGGTKFAQDGFSLYSPGDSPSCPEGGSLCLGRS